MKNTHDSLLTQDIVETPATDPEYSDREEEDPLGLGVELDDGCDSKPKGRPQPENTYLKTRRNNLRIATWNVRTLYKAGKIGNLAQEAENMNLDILGVAETRWTDTGYLNTDNYAFIYSGGNKHQHGVGLLIKKHLTKHIMGYWTVNERIILMKLHAQPFNIAILQLYAPTQDYSDEDLEQFYEEISQVLKQVKSTDVLIVMGDLNAKVGSDKNNKIVGQYGLGRKNERGDRLIQFCTENKLVIANTFYQHPRRKLYTWKSPGDVNRNQIDFIMITERFKNSIKQVKTYPSADIGSDHNPVVATINIKLKKCDKNARRQPKIDYSALKKPDIKQKYAVAVQNKYDALLAETVEQQQCEANDIDVNLVWHHIKNSIQQGADMLPKKRTNTRKPWMTEEILERMAERKKLKHKAAEYHQINKTIDSACRIAKETWYNEKCEVIENLSKSHQTRTMHQKIKEITNKKYSNRNNGCIRDKNGNILFDKEDIKKRWAEYVHDLFDDQRGEKPTIPGTSGPPIIRSELIDALAKMKDNKAAGLDNITAECLKALNETSIDVLIKLCNKIYDGGELPEDMQKSIFVTIPKKNKATECSDFRTISLMSHVTKLLLRILLTRIKKKINAEVNEEQFGFRKESGTREAIFTIRNIIERYIEKKKTIYICFIDYAKAFDRVQHQKLITSLKNIGIDGKDLRLIANLYWDQTATVRVDGDTSASVEIKRGVRQGCVLSPSLFNLYTEVIFKEAEDFRGITIGGKKITNLRYADDTVLLAESPEDLQATLNTIKTKSEEYGLNMNVKKTKVMVVSSKIPSPKAELKLNNEILDQVQQFTYLGQLITEDGYNEAEIARRVGIAKTAFNNMKNLFTSGQLSLKLKLRLLKCYIWSTLLYGAETWTLKKKTSKQLEAFEMWTYRRIGKISWTKKMTNEDVLKKLKITRSLMNTIRIRKLTYLGHIKRHNTIMKETLEGTTPGSRGRGRPRTKWMDNITEWTGMSVQQLNVLCQNRKKWRAVAVNPSTRDDT